MHMDEPQMLSNMKHVEGDREVGLDIPTPTQLETIGYVMHNTLDSRSLGNTLIQGDDNMEWWTSVKVTSKDEEDFDIAEEGFDIPEPSGVDCSFTQVADEGP